MLDLDIGKLATPVALTKFEPDKFAVKVETDRPETNLLSTYRVFY